MRAQQRGGGVGLRHGVQRGRAFQRHRHGRLFAVQQHGFVDRYVLGQRGAGRSAHERGQQNCGKFPYHANYLLLV